jgi:hypothetical protein
MPSGTDAKCETDMNANRRWWGNGEGNQPWPISVQYLGAYMDEKNIYIYIFKTFRSSTFLWVDTWDAAM